MQNPIMKYFEYAHLPEHLQNVSKPFGDMANVMNALLPERIVAIHSCSLLCCALHRSHLHSWHARRRAEPMTACEEIRFALSLSCHSPSSGTSSRTASRRARPRQAVDVRTLGTSRDRLVCVFLARREKCKRGNVEKRQSRDHAESMQAIGRPFPMHWHRLPGHGRLLEEVPAQPLHHRERVDTLPWGRGEEGR